MSDRGTIEPVKSPKYIDLTAGERKVLVSARAAAPTIRAPEGGVAPQRTMFRSLDELAGTPEFKGMLDREFPQAASEWDDSVSRRNFIKLMGASLALAGLATGCAQKPEEKILPYVQQPEHVVPGRPLFFATTMPWGGFGKGVLVEQHEGRPTKIEGNEQHPASLGAADIWGQASILGLYDPDRSQAITRFGNVSSWGSFLESLQSALTFEDWNGAKATRRSKPARVRILTETTTSPTFKAAVESARASVGGSLE